MWHSSALRVLATEIPVDPNAAEAQRWAEEELARSVYHENNLFTTIGTWILDVLSRLFSGALGSSNPLVAVILLLLVVVAAVLTIVFAERVRRVRNVTAERTSHELFDDSRSASELRDGARAALARGDLAAAFLDSYRAIIRSLDERVLIDDRPGLTAQEAAHLATVPFPDHGPTWQWASGLFDAVCYGRRVPGRADVEHLLEFDGLVGRTAPAASAVVGVSAGQVTGGAGARNPMEVAP